MICLSLLKNNIVTMPGEHHIPKMKTSFYGFGSIQVKSFEHYNKIIETIHFATEDSIKRFEVIKKIKNTLL